jgi:integrase
VAADQVAALLHAAGRHRALLATAVMAGGLRASELTGLRWRDVDLAAGWLNVATSKTDAGIRRVDLAPHLLDELKIWKASTTTPSRTTSCSQPGGERANAGLITTGRPPITAGVTFHSLRRTYATLMAQEGVDQRYTMDWRPAEDADGRAAG